MEEPAPKKALDPKAALQSLREMFAVMDPQEVVEIKAASGRTYTVRTTLPARRQIRTLGLLEAALEAAWATEAPPEATEEKEKGSRFLALVKAAMGNTTILDRVAEAFGVAFHEEVEKERKEAGVQVTDGKPEITPLGTVAADLFPAEEMVEALLPLLARLVVKALGTMEAVKASQLQKRIAIQPES